MHDRPLKYTTSAVDEQEVAGDLSAPTAPQLALTDFMDLDTLQEIQDSFTAVTRISTNIHDSNGHTITAPTDSNLRGRSDDVFEQLVGPERDEQGRFIAPIIVEGQQLGSISLEGIAAALPATPDAQVRFSKAAKSLGLNPQQTQDLLHVAEQTCGANHAASIQFLYLLANSIARLCYEQYHSSRRVEELSVLYKMSTLLAAQRKLQPVLEKGSRMIADTMEAKAVSIRLVDKKNGQLVQRATYNLSQQYLDKGPINFKLSEAFSRAMKGEIVYIENMSQDQRILYPKQAKQEGLVAMLITGILYQGKPIGTLVLYTDKPRKFSAFEMRLVKAIAELMAAAIETARLEQKRVEHREMTRQLKLAADVQKRMLPRHTPNQERIDIAARYIPCYDLAGDFYDFIKLKQKLGIALGDAVGKGVPASLLMSSVRASLRAYAHDVNDLGKVMSRVNIDLCRDTLDNEFATLWYGSINPDTLEMTYCNAGHEPGLLISNGQITALGEGGMIVGVDPQQTYTKPSVQLKPGDTLLLHSDGLTDSFNKEGHRFGRQRINSALLEADSNATASDLLNHLLQKVHRFTGNQRPTDDITVVVIKVRKPASS